jgi:hypothetical protein
MEWHLLIMIPSEMHGIFDTMLALYGGNKTLIEPDINAGCQLQSEHLAVEGAQPAVHAASGHHLITLLESIQKRPMLLRLLLLRTDEQEIKNGKHEYERDHPLKLGHHATSDEPPAGDPVANTNPNILLPPVLFCIVHKFHYCSLDANFI